MVPSVPLRREPVRARDAAVDGFVRRSRRAADRSTHLLGVSARAAFVLGLSRRRPIRASNPRSADHANSSGPKDQYA